jgi:hypothetical protein
MKTDEALYRYQVQSDGQWRVSAFDVSGIPNKGPTAGQRGMEPDWLKLILDVAGAAEAFIEPEFQPPYRILWFRVDQSYNLIRFGYD